MLPKISEEELAIFEVLRNPISATEILFSDIENLAEFTAKCSEVRKYQWHFFSWDSLFFENPKLTKAENYQIKNGFSESYILGGRLTGKSRIGLIIDSLLALIHCTFTQGSVSSADADKLKNVMEKIFVALEYHPIFKLLKIRVKRNPYQALVPNGACLESVNNNVTGKNPGCFDDKTEVLTDKGWKFFEHLTLEDKVLSVNLKNYQSIFCNISKIIKEKFIGNLNRFYNDSSEFLFTTNHNLVVKGRSKSYVTNDVNNLPKQIYFPSVFKWNGTKKDIKLSGIVNSKKEEFIIPIEKWVRFIAWYLAEGSLRIHNKHYRIIIAQKKHTAILECLLNELNLKYNKKIVKSSGCYNYVISNKLLALHLDKYFGRSKNKKIAKYFKNLDSSLLVSFINEYILCDGNCRVRNKKDIKVIYCSVLNLINELQEVAQKAGYKTTCRSVQRYVNFNGYNYESLLYVLSLCHSTAIVFSKDKIESINYNGYVYCLDTCPFHTMVIRRKGKVIISGNSHWHGRHDQKNWEEESSYLTSKVTNEKLMAQAEEGCIKEGSKILMSDFSTKNIEDVNIGDKIISWNEEKNCLCEDTVIKSWFSGIKNVIKITDESNELWLTPDHKIRTNSQGDRVFRWKPAIQCSLTNYYLKTYNYISDYNKYLQGILLGLIESDGSKVYFNNGSIQFMICQADEVEYVEFILNKLEITFSKILQKKMNEWNKKDFYKFNIFRANNGKILEIYDLLLSDIDVKYGFIAGFIVGDGYVDKRHGTLSISQSYKEHPKKIELIESTLHSLKIHYNKTIRTSNQTVNINISKYDIPFVMKECKKMNNFKKYILNVERPVHFKKHVSLKGFLEQQKVYDLETGNHNFIANGFIVHNCVNHYTGMTTFTKMSPMGKVFYNLKNQDKIVNLPSYVNPTWNAEKEEAAILEFGGKSSAGFKVQILGEVIESGESVLDIERIRETYIKDKDGSAIPIKAFEINRNNFFRFKELIVIDRPRNAESLTVAMDIGEGGAPTEIIVLPKINDVYKYEYNITTFKISPEENEEVVRFIIETVKANVVGIDTTSGGGKALFSSLAKQYAENLVSVSFNEKINIDFDKDESGNLIYSNGKLTYKQEYIIDWSVQRLKNIFYNKKIECLLDYKLDQQLEGLVVMQSGQRTLYMIKGANHLFQAFQVFSICDWNTEFKNIKPIQKFRKSFGAM